MSAKTEAQIEDLYKVPEQSKAEIVNGELVEMPPTGDDPAYASFEIAVSLREYVRRNHNGRVAGDNVGFIVNLPNRKSFSPDAAFHNLPKAGMGFLQGTPLFAVEVRSENDYGPPAEERIKKKRDDYFAAGTQVVWDVDLLSDEVVRVYRHDNPSTPTIYRRGQIAEAEPAVPGWKMAVDDLFAPAE